MATNLIPCVVYAAKSTDDKRGSIPTQISDCRTAIKAAGEREIVAEYDDVAVSAYTGNRGGGLADAMRHAVDLTRLYAGAELWVQHSDRLARGDGKLARHVVEIALWANRADVTIRSLQDPDTFRDLLYAVVTGQRNHLDSKRKGASVAAGLRRTVERGSYAGVCIDGYRVRVQVDAENAVSKRLEIDPERAPLISMIFDMARAGHTAEQTADAVTANGWTTPRGSRDGLPVRFEAAGILRVLRNPRYAGLSTWKGEVLAKAQWPAYVSPEEFRVLSSERMGKRRSRSLGPHPREPFLLVGVARCALCGSAIHAVTHAVRHDGTRARSYLCRAHRHKHCEARPIDAVAVDSTFVGHLAEILAADQSPGLDQTTHAGAPADPRVGQLKERIADALAANSFSAAGTLLDELLLHTEQGAATPTGGPVPTEPLVRDGGPLRRSLLAGFHAWIASALDHPEKIPVVETEHLRRLLTRWFDRVELRCVRDGFEMKVVPKYPARPRLIRVDYDQWRLSMATAGYERRPRTAWSRDEIAHAFTEWVALHGEIPLTTEWDRATAAHPFAGTVRDTFGSWRAGLVAAGYTHARPRRVPPSRDRDILGRYA